MILDGLTVLISGGTGSFGKCFTKTILKGKPHKVIIFSRDELKQSEMRQELNDDRVLFFLGDVRDRDRLYRALNGVDVIIHAAALKQVPALEYDPQEAIKTNIMGASNVIDASIANNVQKVVAISTDKACLDYHSRITLADGRTLAINEIVRNKLPIGIKTFTRNGITTSTITGWFKNKLDDRAMLDVGYENQYHHIGYKKGVLVTEDHPILTINGWKRAANIEEQDLLITSELAPNFRQSALLCGSILGDSSISKHIRPYIKFGHAEDQREWLTIKRNALLSLKPNEIKSQKHSNRKNTFLIFSLPSMASFAQFRDGFIENGKKHVARELFENLFSPELLATWFMDDGCCSGKNARIATHGYCRDDVEWLATILTSKGLVSYSYKVCAAGKEYYELRFTVDGSRALFNIISPLIPDSMRHKLSDWQQEMRGYNPESWNLGEAIQYIAKPIIRKLVDIKTPRQISLPPDNAKKEFCLRGHPLIEENIIPNNKLKRRQCKLCVKELLDKRRGISYLKKDVYNISVEGTENFICNGVILHNCNPVNIYGATKLAMEKLLIAANSYVGKDRETRFSLVRYGNVAGSRGSVIPYFQKIKDQGFIPITDRRMTRFWITLNEGVQLVLKALEEMHGGEIFIPKIPSVRIIDIAEAIAPGVRHEIIGIRPGEKLHEVLISESESPMTYEYRDYYTIHPSFPFWTKKKLNGGKKVKDGFKYDSYSNDKWIQIPQIKELICGLNA